MGTKALYLGVKLAGCEVELYLYAAYTPSWCVQGHIKTVISLGQYGLNSNGLRQVISEHEQETLLLVVDVVVVVVIIVMITKIIIILNLLSPVSYQVAVSW